MAQTKIADRRRSAGNRVCSIFSQLLQLFPGLEFEQVVKEHRAERPANWDSRNKDEHRQPNENSTYVRLIGTANEKLHSRVGVRKQPTWFRQLLLRYQIVQ